MKHRIIVFLIYICSCTGCPERQIFIFILISHITDENNYLLPYLNFNEKLMVLEIHINYKDNFYFLN